jgi:arylsulfatase A-like enzyme
MVDTNVLLVTVDSLRADHVGYHGYERDTTPFLDELADSGSAFRKAFAPAGGTKFSFPSTLTGVYPTMYGGHEQVSEDQTLISEIFQDGGYTTGGFHSNLYLSEDYGYDRGWDEFYDSKPDSSTTTDIRSFLKKAVHGTPLYPYALKAYDTMESITGVNVGSYLVPADEKTDMALNFVNKVDADDNVFLWVHYMDPHHPFLPPEKYQRMFHDEIIGRRESVKMRQKLLQRPEEVTEEELQMQLNLYDAETRFWDDELRRLVETTREKLGDVTVAVTSDHGEHFLEHGYFSGAQLYDIKQHVPLLIEGEQWDDDGDYDDLVCLIDLPTTLVDHAGLDVPDNYYGHSLIPLVEDGNWPREEIFGGLDVDEDGPRYACRTQEWKYIWSANGDPELYDLTTDPGEQRNVVSEHPDVVEDLDGRLEKHRQQVQVTEQDVSVETSEDVKERLRRLGYKE